MSDQPLQVVASCGESTCRVYISGEADYAASGELRTALEDVLDHTAGDMELDLANVTFIDSEGVKVLLAVFEEARQRARRCRIARSSRQVQRFLDLSGIGAFLSGEG